MATVTLDDMNRMSQPKRLGDLVQDMTGDLGIVARTSPCPEGGCTGDIGVRHLGKPYMGVGCTRSGDWKLIARAAELAVSQAAANLSLAAIDEWGRPRCQEIGNYVDTGAAYQCAMVTGHDGECDPLPVYPDAEPQDGQESPSLLNRMIEEINTNPIARRAFGRLSELDRVR